MSFLKFIELLNNLFRFLIITYSLEIKLLKSPLNHLKPAPKFRMTDIEIGVTFLTLRSLAIPSGSWVKVMPEKHVEKQHIGRLFLLNPP